MRNVFLIFFIHQFVLNVVSHAIQDQSSHENCYPNCLNLSPDPNRFRRNPTGDPFHGSVDKIRKIGHITNGMYLLKGFTSGTISSDDFITEILHLGSFTPSQFKSLDLTKVRTAMEDLKNLPDQLAATDELKKIEKRYLAIAEIRSNVSDFGSVMESALVNSFKAELESMKAFVVDSEKFDNVKEEIDSFEAKVKEIQKLRVSDQDYQKKAPVYLDDLRKIIKNMQAAGKEAKGLISFKELQSSDVVYGPVLKMVEGLEILKRKAAVISSFSGDVDGESLFENHLKAFPSPSLNSQLDDVKPLMDDLLSFYNARQKAFNDPVKFTNAFKEASRIGQASDDVMEFKELIREAESLSKSLERLKNVSEVSASTESGFGSSLEKVKKSIETFFKARTLLQSASKETTTVISATKGVKKCELFKLQTDVVLDGVNEFKKELSVFKAKVDSMVKVQEAADYFGKETEIFKKITLLSTEDKTKKIEDVIKTLLESGEFKKVFEYLSKVDAKLFDSLTDLKTNPFSTYIASLSATFPKLEAFRKLVDPHEKAFQCLNAVKNVEDILKSIKTLQDFRKSTDLKTGLDIPGLDNLGKAVIGMEQIELIVIRLKNINDNEMEHLTLFEKLSETSITLGTSSRGVVQLQELVDSKPKFDVVKSQLSLVKNEISGVKGLAQYEIDSLNKLEEVGKMLDELEKFKGGMSGGVFENFESYGPLIMEAQAVTGVDDGQKVSKSVGKLESLVKDPSKKQKLKGLKAALDALNSIGLGLQNYNKEFGASLESLKDLDLFFANRAKKFVTVPPPTIVIPTQEPTSVKVQASTTVLLETTTVVALIPFYQETWFHYLCGFLFAVSVIVLLICLCRKKKWLCFATKNMRKEKPKNTNTTQIPNDKDKPAEQQPLLEQQKINKVNEEVKQAPVAQSVQKQEVKKPEEIAEIPKKNESSSKKNSEDPVASLQLSKREEKVERKGQLEAYNLPGATYGKLIHSLYRVIAIYQKKRSMWDQYFILRRAALDDYCCWIVDTVKKVCEVLEQEPTGLFPKENRSNVFMHDDNRIQLHIDCVDLCEHSNHWMNGACLVMPNLARFFLIPAPIVPAKKGDSHVNMDKYFFFIAQTKTDAVVFLFSEDELRNTPKEPNYGRFYPKEAGKSKKIPIKGESGENLTITCTEVKQIGGQTERTMKVEFQHAAGKPKKSTNKDDVNSLDIDEMDEAKKKRKNRERDEVEAREKREWVHDCFDAYSIEHTFKLYEINDWKKAGIPEKTDDLRAVINAIIGMPNVIVSCSDGVERSGSFAYAELIRQRLGKRMIGQESADIDYLSAAIEVRKARPGSMECADQIAFAIEMLTKETREIHDKSIEAGNHLPGMCDGFLKYDNELTHAFTYIHLPTIASNAEAEKKTEAVKTTDPPVKKMDGAKTTAPVNKAEGADKVSLEEQKTQTNSP